MEKLAYEVDFDEELDFEAVRDAGFRFGNLPAKMFFVPCYSEQSGCYSIDLDIYFNGKKVIGVECEGRN